MTSSASNGYPRPPSARWILQFTPGQAVRVVVLETSESISAKISGWRRVHIGEHVRSIDESGHILACHLPVVALELFSGRRENDPTWQSYDAAWEKRRR